ncbi:uncharacterized protein K452DRAFT_249064 [Aplosporella prunicola CBS 121167]|uniref:DUF654-domain-containing protein n=1 Tax=Aplosporella prunicola CBS 121167 TaxID=1176127 RepID=A0A6A6BFP6_9PEZI|nr:uncharacterized protein K452DRAFT_249064 [Aplosporella prunicola CBS 121167]KAF2142388.1 hypothetical protein K452DRAFT_249064 [Aplosporella prunicola CBS 121167]
MSARALRKAQRELEEKRQQELAAQRAEEEEDSEEELSSRPQAKPSLFAMLGGDDDDDDEEQDEAEEALAAREESEEEPATTPQPKATSAKRKKKKKKGKGAAKSANETPTRDYTETSQLDEIDIALRSLNVTKPGGDAKPTEESSLDPSVHELYKLLSIDSQSLHAANEMRRLFGRAALERDDDEAAPGGRRGRGAQQMGLAGAVAGRNMPGGRGLASLGLRRNLFIQGKEEWPRATAGGLGMEIVEKRADGTVEYRFVHNGAYQDVQRQFESCVASMDPNRMVQLLQFNPYHISTLLQVSEIAKQERDHATSGDLLERALFSFGRAVHSTFSNNLTQGKARFDFRRPENREFWLAAWRYVSNLGMRATWRTVYEWAKLLLSLDPENDPFCVRLVIDQFAFRGRSQQDFINLAESEFFKTRWQHLPNVQMTLGLAYVQTGNRSKGQQKLFTAIGRYPWVAARLFQELELNDTPPGIWGKQPRTPYENLVTELYVVRAKDVWNTPEAKNLLVEVASAVQPSAAAAVEADHPITRDVARHTILTDNPTLISLVPRSLTSKVASASDPLPPEDNMASYDPSPRAANPRRAAQNEAEIRREYSTLRTFFQSIMPWFRPDAPEGGAAEAAEMPTEEEVERRIVESGIPFQEFWERTERFAQLQNAIDVIDGMERAPAELPDLETMQAQSLAEAEAEAEAEGGGGDTARDDREQEH